MKANMRHLVFSFFISLVGISLFWGCDEDNFLYPDSNSIYFSSFESKKDTLGWQGYGYIEFQSEAPVGGAKQSLYVSGGCVVPHARYVLPPMPRDGYYQLQCWGKDLGIGGGVTLTIDDKEVNQLIWLGINKPEWTFFETDQNLFCPANQRMKLTLNAGGKAPSAMLVDLIQVIIVK